MWHKDFRYRKLILFYSFLCCVLLLLEVALSQSRPSFSVLCYPCPYHSLLLHNVISPTTFWSSEWSYTLYLPLCTSNSPSIVFHSGDVSSPFQMNCQMMVLPILSFSWILNILLSIPRWLVSSFFSDVFVRDPVWHSYDIAGMTHWLKTFPFRLMGMSG